jgi:hypothetical protein
MSANAYYRELRDEGIAARRTEVLQLFKIAKSIVVRSGYEPLRDPDQVPSGDEIAPWPSKKSTGISQNVTITYRDKVTGKISQTYWRTVTPNGITRAEAMAAAIDAYSETAERYNQDLIGAVHTSALRLTPGLVK